MGIREIVILLILITAGISFYFGRKITLEWLDDDIKRKAFESAKADYMEFFHTHLDLNGGSALEKALQDLVTENEELTKENEELRNRLGEGKRKKK